ncbi:MAG: hypothetical protein IKX67_00690 [Bacteroidales bacterium]|nr:hypothetical protein [Bacteroidales bacterium]
MEQLTTNPNGYASPDARVILVKPAKCIAGSDRVSNMNKSSIYEEEF